MDRAGPRRVGPECFDWRVPLGHDDESGEQVVLHLLRLAHCLFAGSTRSGKSTGMLRLVTEIVRLSPQRVGLTIADPKRVDWGPFADAPQLTHDVLTEADQVVAVLQELEREVHRRFQTLEKLEERSVEVALSHGKRLPFAPLRVFVLDEAPLAIAQRPAIGESLTHLAAIGGAAGLVLVLAAQQASVRRLPTGLLANAPNRVCFRVTSVANSLQALGRAGAEKLKRPGDFLFVGPACDDGEARGRTVEITSDQVHQAVQRAAEEFSDYARPRKRLPPDGLRSMGVRKGTVPFSLRENRDSPQVVSTTRAVSTAKRVRALMARAGMAAVAAARACWPVVRLLGALVATLFAACEWVLAGVAYWFRRQTRSLNRKARPPRQRTGRRRRRR